MADTNPDNTTFDAQKVLGGAGCPAIFFNFFLHGLLHSFGNRLYLAQRNW